MPESEVKAKSRLEGHGICIMADQSNSPFEGL